MLAQLHYRADHCPTAYRPQHYRFFVRREASRIQQSASDPDIALHCSLVWQETNGMTDRVQEAVGR